MKLKHLLIKVAIVDHIIVLCIINRTITNLYFDPICMYVALVHEANNASTYIKF